MKINLRLRLLVFSLGLTTCVPSSNFTAFGGQAQLPQILSTSFRNHIFQIMGTQLQNITSLKLSQNNSDIPISILSKTPTSVSASFDSNSVLSASAPATLVVNSPQGSSTALLTVDLSNTSVANFNSTGIADTAPSTLLTLSADSKVGIGTTSPTSSLTVAGPIESTLGGIKFPDGSSQTSALATQQAFALSCSFNSSNNQTVCIRLNTLTGASVCSYNVGSGAWTACTNSPFTADVNANYSISCSFNSSYNFTICVRLNNTTGASICNFNNNNPSSGTWSACAGNPF